MNEQLRILVVDDDYRMAKTLVDILKVKGYQAETAFSGFEGLQKIKDGNFDCLVTDIKMPGMNGVELNRAVQEIQPQLPIVLMTAYATNELVQDGLSEGAIGVLNKPLDINLVLSLFSSLADERSIVIVDDDPNFCRTLGDILRARGYSTVEVTCAADIDGAIIQEAQMVMLDMKLGTASGLDILRNIRGKHSQLPVVLVTGYREEMASAIETALELSAFTCLYKPVQIEELFDIINQVHHQELGRLLGTPTRKLMPDET